MRGGLGFLIREGLRAGLAHAWCHALWALTLALALTAGTALLVLPADKEASRPYTQAFLLATISPDLAERDIDEVAWRIWGWEGVEQVSFRFPGEDDPAPIERRTLVVLLASPETRGAVQELLLHEDGIEQVTYVQRTVKPPPRLPSTARILALVGLVVALGAAIWLGRWAMAKTAKSWSEALALLRSSGVEEWTLRIPFLLLGGLVGLLGALVYLGLLWGMWAWAQGNPAVRQVTPAFLTCGPLATALGLILGILLGLLGGLVGYPSRGDHS